MKGLYLAFAPRDVKQAYDFISGALTLEARVTGEIKDIAALLKVELDKLIVRDRAGNFVVANESLRLGVANISGKITGKLTNSGFRFTLPKTGSVISDDLLVINLDNKKYFYSKIKNQN